MKKLKLPTVSYLGQKLAIDCDWYGKLIVRVFLFALTDANFHTELERIKPLLCKTFEIQEEDV